MKVEFSNKDREDIVKALEYRDVPITDVQVKHSLERMRGYLESHFNAALRYVAEDAYYEGYYVR